MKEFICGIKVQAPNGDEAVKHIVSDAGYESFISSESRICMTTNVYEANIAIITMVGLGINFFLLGVLYTLFSINRSKKERI